MGGGKSKINSDPVMTRMSFLIQVKKGMEKEYQRRHNPIWPELEKIYREHGVHNFSIFLHEATGQLFGYYEVDEASRLSELETNCVCKKWWKYMAEILVCNDGHSDKGKEEMLREVFHIS